MKIVAGEGLQNPLDRDLAHFGVRKWPRAPLVDLGAVAYFRLRRGYTAASLRPWVVEVASALAAHDEVHVYFKHDPGSPALARRLLRLAAKESASR